MEKRAKDIDLSNFLGGSLNILGLKIDMADLLNSPDKLKDGMEKLREKLKSIGGREVLSDEEWRGGSSTVSGYIRTRGILGDQEYHIGTMGKPEKYEISSKEAANSEEIEPPADVFDEGDQILVIVDVPGMSLDDLEFSLEKNVFLLSTKLESRRRYRKEIHFDVDLEPESLEVLCRNGILEARIHKSG